MYICVYIYICTQYISTHGPFFWIGPTGNFLGTCRSHGGQPKHHTELGVNKVATNNHDPGRGSHGEMAHDGTKKTATKDLLDSNSN